jgi:predicted Zn-dependent protease
VAVKQLTVRDDPTQKLWRGQPLLGHYPVDDDSVAPQPITLVEKGVLKTYFMSRVPTEKVKESNGHSRAGSGSVGNLFVETSEPMSREAMKKKLLELAHEEDLEYGLLVEEFDDYGEGRGYGGGSSAVSFPVPLVVWRVYPDGREELERGTRFKPATFRLLKEIVALGDDPTLTNTMQRGQRVSVVAPSVLVRVMELQKQREEFERPPQLPRPELKAMRP